MAKWVEKYKKLVYSSHKRHLIVTDPDDLFNYVELQKSLEEEGYQVVRAKTDLEARVLVETKVRDSGGKFLLVAPLGYQALPDLLQLADFKTIGLGHLFPNLDSKAIQGLGFNALALLSNIKPYEELGHRHTLKFLLENIYNVDFDTLTQVNGRERVLNALIVVFQEESQLNKPLRKYLAELTKPYFPDLAGQEINQVMLFEFINSEWEGFVSNKTSLINFYHPALIKSLGYLFALGFLKPVKVSREVFDEFPSQLKPGVFVNEDDTNDNELEGLIQFLHEQAGQIEDLYDQWFNLIQILANAKLKFLRTNNQTLQDRYSETEKLLNQRFQLFIENSYNSLFTLSGVRKPVIVSRILEHMKANPAKKKALIVLDGINYWQWMLIGQKLMEEGIKTHSQATFAFIPTITAWSRQAIFRGEKPDLSETNAKEKKYFQQYWLSHNYPNHQIAFRKFGINEKDPLPEISEDIRILGMVSNDLDDVLHGSILGEKMLSASTLEWITKVKFIATIKNLIDKGFQIFITTDHGNIEATGIKNLSIKEKVGAISRSKRHLNFSNETLLQSFTEQNSGLSMGRVNLSVFLRNYEAFTVENQQIITHGGSHFWEVIIPFIKVDEKQ